MPHTVLCNGLACVSRYREDCEKLDRLVLGVKEVLHTAAENGADMTTKQWASALEVRHA